MDGVSIRDERPSDHAAVNALIAASFAPMPFGDGTEVAVAAALRAAGAAWPALVAERDGAIVGQVLFSPASVGEAPSGWRTLGPLAVVGAMQRRGIGGALIAEGLRRLREAGATGCIVKGDPSYYGRFGFAPAPTLSPIGAPEAYFMALPLAGVQPVARFGFHPAFGA